MANASAAAVTVVNTAMVVTGAVSGTIVAGMTVTMAGVPPGVTVSSGPGGAGTYVVTASAANVSSPEAAVFSLAGLMALVGNCAAAQLVDFGLAAGFGIVFASAFGSGTAAQAAEYQHGTHAAALYNAQAQSGTAIFPSVSVQEGSPIFAMPVTAPQYVDPPQPVISLASLEKAPVNRAITLTQGAPQQYDFSVQGAIFRPVLAQSAIGFGAEYQHGTHAKALYDSQNSSVTWGAVRSPPTAANLAPLHTIVVPPQSVDLTLQGWIKTIPVNQGWLLTMVTAGPQLADLTLQATLISAQPFQSSAPALPINPLWLAGVPQADPTQIQPAIFKPPTVAAKPQQIPQVFASPTPWDPTTIQGRIFTTALPGPARYVQPAFVQCYEPQVDRTLYPQPFAVPMVLQPLPAAGFRVCAVTAGWYHGKFRTPGDVFDIRFAAEYSDSTIDYQPTSSGTIGFGWMLRVAPTTPLFNWLESNNAPYLPPQDPNRRFIY